MRNLRFLLVFPFLFLSSVFAYPADFKKQNVVRETLDKFELSSQNRLKSKKKKPTYPKSLTTDYFSRREKEIKKTLREIEIEIALEVGFAMGGKQAFELFNDYDGDGKQERVSRLEYPHQGKMFIFKGEVGFLSKFFLGGRYGSSSFSKKICSDEDWHIYDPWWPHGTDNYIDYQITRQMSEPKVEFFDVNLYYRLLDLDKERMKQIRSSSKEDTIFDYLVTDTLSLDIFAGYQQQKGRYRAIDPMIEFLRFDEGTWYYARGFPANIGLDSFYKIRYRGPRIGIKAGGSRGKIATRVSFAYAWLRTDAYGWWNLRNLSFWQSGKNGYGIDMGIEVLYSFTPSLFAGFGYNWLYSYQKELKLSAIEAGSPWPEGPTIRNADSKIYGPSILLRCAW